MKNIVMLLITLSFFLTPISGKANPAGVALLNPTPLQVSQLGPWVTSVIAGLTLTAEGLFAPVLVVACASAAVYVLENPTLLNPYSRSKTERYLARVVLPSIRISMMSNANPALRTWGEHLFQKQIAYSQQTGNWVFYSTEEMTEKPSQVKSPVVDEGDIELAKKALEDLVGSGAIRVHPTAPLKEGAKEEIEVRIEKLPVSIQTHVRIWVQEHFQRWAAALRLSKIPKTKRPR